MNLLRAVHFFDRGLVTLRSDLVIWVTGIVDAILAWVEGVGVVGVGLVES